jgi:hypothetical protein
MDGTLHRSSPRTEGSSLSGYGTAFDVGGSPQISTATASHRGATQSYALYLAPTGGIPFRDQFKVTGQPLQQGIPAPVMLDHNASALQDGLLTMLQQEALSAQTAISRAARATSMKWP